MVFQIENLIENVINQKCLNLMDLSQEIVSLVIQTDQRDYASKFKEKVNSFKNQLLKDELVTESDLSTFSEVDIYEKIISPLYLKVVKKHL